MTSARRYVPHGKMLPNAIAVINSSPHLLFGPPRMTHDNDYKVNLSFTLSCVELLQSNTPESMRI
jgi:hypothetical protein